MPFGFHPNLLIPLLGRLIVPSKYGERYAIGHIVEEKKHLFVTPGIGTSILPIRFLVPPEISILSIKSSLDHKTIKQESE